MNSKPISLWTLTLVENKFHVQVRELKIYSTISTVRAMSEDKIISINSSKYPVNGSQSTWTQKVYTES